MDNSVTHIEEKEAQTGIKKGENVLFCYNTLQ